MFKTKEREKVERIMKKVLEEHGLVALPSNSLRSIEELAKLHRGIKGLGLGYLSRSQIKWLYSGGFEAYEKAKPTIYRLLKEMEEIPCVFPVNLREVADIVQERIRERAKKGEIDKKWEKIVITPAEIESVLRFKRDPFFSKEEKTELMVETLVEVLEEMYKEEKAKHKVEEPEVKVALEVAKKWLDRFRKAQKLTSKQRKT